MSAKLAICVCTDVGQEVLRTDASPQEAIDLMREACANPEYQAVWARRERADGSTHVVYLSELEEKFAY